MPLKIPKLDQEPDVTFIVGEERERIPCHQLLLKMRSPVFQVMFSERWSQDIPQVPLEDVNPEAFKKFLKFIYADELSADVPKALELLELADKYDVQQLVSQCEQLLMDEMTLEDAVPVFQAARKYDKKSLMDTAGDMLAASLLQIQTLPSFTQLDKETLKYILKTDDVEMTEVDIFRLALQWAENQRDVTTVEESLEDILPLIRFPTMTRSEFTTTVVPTKVLPQAKVDELSTYFDTDDKAKRWSLAKTLGFSAQKRQPKDLAQYEVIYGDFDEKISRHQEFGSLKECLHFHESLFFLREILEDPEDDSILRIGLSGFSFHCPVASERVLSPSLKSFKICLKSKDCHDDQYDYSSDQSYTELLNMSPVDVEEGQSTNVRFDAVVPLKKSTLYCITIEEITSSEGDVALQGYEAEDFGLGPRALLTVRLRGMWRARTGLTIKRNELQGFRSTYSAGSRPQLISRLAFLKLL